MKRLRRSRIFTLLTASLFLSGLHLQASAQAASNVINYTSSRQNRPAIQRSNPPTLQPSAVPTPFQPSPKRSALYSAMLPGAGQFYNRQYWKLALVYAGAAAATYYLIDNTTNYQKYRKAYVARLTDPNVQDEFTDHWPGGPQIVLLNLQAEQNYYKRNLDLTILLSTIGYTLQVLDALAFAHLRNFDVSPNISLRLAPVSTPLGGAIGIVVRRRESGGGTWQAGGMM